MNWYFLETRPLVCQRDAYSVTPQLEKIHEKCDKRIKHIRMAFVSKEAIIVYVNMIDEQLGLLHPVIKFLIIEDDALNTNIEYVGAETRYFVIPIYLFLLRRRYSSNVLHMLKEFVKKNSVFSFSILSDCLSRNIKNDIFSNSPLTENMMGIENCLNSHPVTQLDDEILTLQSANQNNAINNIYYPFIEEFICDLYSRVNTSNLQDIILKQFTPFELFHGSRFDYSAMKAYTEECYLNAKNKQNAINDKDLAIFKTFQNVYDEHQSKETAQQFKHFTRPLLKSNMLQIFLDSITLKRKSNIAFEYFKTLVNLDTIAVDLSKYFFQIDRSAFLPFKNTDLYGYFYCHDTNSNQLSVRSIHYNVLTSNNLDYYFNGCRLNILSAHLATHYREKRIEKGSLAEELLLEFLSD